jgi:hypothetical protein
MSDLCLLQSQPYKHPIVAVGMLHLHQLVQQKMLAELQRLIALEQQLQSLMTLRSSYDYFPLDMVGKDVERILSQCMYAG